MEKTIYFYKYIDGVNDLSFPEQGQIQTSEFRVDYKRMGAAPTITCTILHHLCLDKIWDENVYVVFNNERFFLKQIPTSSYSNSDSRYKHDVELVGERAILDNVYFYDVAKDDIEVDKPISNSSNFVFFGDIHEFASRLNYSLSYSNVDYKVVVDSDITSESKSVSFQDQFISNALQECYNVYGLPYYFIGKTIHIGFTNNAVTHTFKYGVDESLLSIQKQNANYKIVNRVTGVGSSDNIPYYYPNDYESKEEVEANGGKWVKPQQNLMPPIYRETLGDERFYNALNNTYISPQTGEFYSFENPFVEGKPKEHIVNFEDIKPSIKGITNLENQRIDMFVDFAYDEDDNDETDEDGNYLHPYFFAKLRKFNGDYGFNLFDHAIEEQEMVISMTGGSCGSCEWIIGVDETSQKNTVQVDRYGKLIRDEKGNIKFGTPQDIQNDTRNYEVWVALKKDINTFGVIMPNASNNYKPRVDDTFVILHIDLPKAYILSAENRLEEQLIKYMAMNNSEKFTFSIGFSRIFFADNPQILAQLNENARIQIEYDDTFYELYISSYSYNMSNDSPLPEIKVELSDTLTIQQNALQNAISEVKQDIMSSVGSGDFLKQGLAYFLRKDTSDRTRGKLSSDVGFEVGKYVSGASGAIIYKDSSTGQTIGEVDKLYVRMKAYFETIGISNVDTVSGKQIISPAGSIKCIGVDELDNSYRCYFIGEQDGTETSNLFHVNDQAYSQTFNAKEGVNNKISNTYYWRLITDVSSDVVVYKNHKCHYIDLSKADCDNGSDIPKEGDIINHRGSRTDVDRMNFIESSSVDAFSPNITLFHGVNSYSLDGKDYVSYGVDKTTNKAYMNVYGDMFVGDRNGSTYMRYTPEEGLVIKGKLDIETKLGNSTLKDLISASSPEGYQEFVEKVTKDIEGLQAQIDGAIESYFYQYAPTLSNYPASSWTTNEIKKEHLNDTFTNLVDGRSWRWTVENGNYKWTEITDTATAQALALAGQAQDTADGKRRVFVSQPKPPYDKGDLWSRGKDYPLLLCVNAKGANGSYDESDWDYADNTEKLQKELEDLVNDTKDELNNAIGQATEAANTYTDNAKSALQTSINELNNAKASVNDVYTKAQADGLISKAEEDAINAAKQQADAAIALSETIVKAYADGVVDAEETARIKQAQENLDTAKAYAEQKAQEALNDALSSLSTFNYLKAALKEDTSIEGGLIQSSLIKLGYTSSNAFNVMSGSNGIYNSALHGGGIASWWGGDTYDLLDYYNWDGTQWIEKRGVTVPNNIPSGLIRFDGTGYFAKGKFWWDNNGEIHADPTALFLSFDVEVGDETLAQTIVSLRTNLGKLAELWVKVDVEGGVSYIKTNNDVVSNGDIIAYSTGSALPSLPISSSENYGLVKIDGVTLQYDENGRLYVAGGGSGGGISSVIPSGSGNAVTGLIYDSSSKSLTYQLGNSFLPLNGGTMNNTNLVGNLNADMLDGLHSDEFLIKGPRVYSKEDFDTKYRFASMYSTDYMSPVDGAYNYGQVLSFVDNCSTTQFYCPDNTGLIYFRNSWGTDSKGSENFANIPWYEIITSKNIGNQTVAKSYALRENTCIFGKESIDAFLIHGEIKFATFQEYAEIGFKSNDGLILSIPWSLDGYGVQLAFDDSKSATMKIRGKEDTWGDWRTIMLDGDTASSANKLSTTRYLWGQSFDGSGNVNGDINFINHGNLITIGGEYWANNTVLYTGYDTTNGDWTKLGVAGEGSNSACLILNYYGRVGIGVDYPTHRLHINGSIKAEYNPDYDLAHTIIGEVHFYNDSYSDPGTNIKAAIKVNGAIAQSSGNVLLCTTSGNVGIGTTNPTVPLHVMGKPIFRTNAHFGNAGAIHIQNDYTITDWDRAINIYYPNMGNGSNVPIHIGISDSTKNGGYIAYHYAGYNSDNNCMKIGLYAVDDILNVTANRRVGINTTTPEATLDVNGDSIFRNHVFVKKYHHIFMNPGEEGVYYTDDGLCWHNANNEYVRSLIKVNNSGYVGIGISDPEYKLDINGNVGVRGPMVVKGTIFMSLNTSLFMSEGNTGIYLSDYGIYWHNSDNTFHSSIMTCDGSITTIYKPLYIQSGLYLNVSDQINGTQAGIALNYECGKAVNTTIWDGKGHHIMRVFGEDRRVAIGPAAIESPRGTLNVDGDVIFENARFITTSGFVDGDCAYSHAIYGGYHDINVCEFYEEKFKFKGNGGGKTFLNLTSNDAVFSGVIQTHSCQYVGKFNGRLRFWLGRDGDTNTWLQAATDTTSEGGKLFMSGHNGTTLSEFNVCATKSTFNGNVIAHGDVTAYSDIRLKNRIESVNNVLDTIDTLDVFRYTWKDREDKSVHIGVSAQQVQTIYPEFVLTSSSEDGTDYLTVNYAALATCIAIQGIKELAKKGDERDKKIVSLETEIKHLKERIKTLEAWS